MKTTLSHTYHKDVLNEAIRKVLTTPMKKDCEEEYRIVKSAGYDVAKQGRGEDGYFEIWNTENNNKSVYLFRRYGWRRHGHTDYELHSYIGKYDHHYMDKTAKQINYIDFVSILDTPANQTYRAIVNAEANGRTYGQWYGASSTTKKYDLKRARQSVKFAQESVEEQQEKIADLAKQIQELTAELPELMADVAKAKAELEQVKKELGLA